MTRFELAENIYKKGSCLCIGLDTDIRKIPTHLLEYEDPVLEFNRRIIEATHEYCVAYKPNLAFYEAGGPAGLISLEKTIHHIPPDIFTIADAKRGDIGNTSEMYARAFFDHYRFDAVTVSPYMGKDSVSPFLREGKWVILLVLTSNTGSMDFQFTDIHSQTTHENKLYEQVLHKSMNWSGPDGLMFVAGATHPELLKSIRMKAPDHFFLVPGIGAQGGDMEAVMRAGMNRQCGLLINSSRQILYASSGEDFADKARETAKSLRDQMSNHLKSIIH
ncbi:MAG: orotidine-5'-phosphate decarboxylase [Bacteroidia bacterium]|nr:orotidine-5'-phosphate decarboxylase [Bacteroidia bacterium]